MKKHSASVLRDRSIEEKQMKAAIEYERDMSKLTRILEQRNASLERAKIIVDESLSSAFEDKAYLAMINQT